MFRMVICWLLRMSLLWVRTDQSPTHQDALSDAIWKNNKEGIIRELALGASIKAFDRHNKLPLQVAIDASNLEIGKFLVLNCGANVAEYYGFHNSIHRVAMEGRFYFLQFFLNHLLREDDVNLQVKNTKETALHLVINNLQSSLLPLLLDADHLYIDAKNKDGLTALMVAVDYGFLKMSCMLINSGASLYLSDKMGQNVSVIANKYPDFNHDLRACIAYRTNNPHATSQNNPSNPCQQCITNNVDEYGDSLEKYEKPQVGAGYRDGLGGHATRQYEYRNGGNRKLMETKSPSLKDIWQLPLYQRRNLFLTHLRHFLGIPQGVMLKFIQRNYCPKVNKKEE